MREYVYNCSSFLSQLRRSRLCIHTHILAPFSRCCTCYQAGAGALVPGGGVNRGMMGSGYGGGYGGGGSSMYGGGYGGGVFFLASCVPPELVCVTVVDRMHVPDPLSRMRVSFVLRVCMKINSAYTHICTHTHPHSLNTQTGKEARSTHQFHFAPSIFKRHMSCTHTHTRTTSNPPPLPFFLGSRVRWWHGKYVW